MKNLILILIVLSSTGLLFGQSAPSQDTVKIGIVFKNAEQINKYADSLQMASNIALYSIMPSRDAQQIKSLISGFLRFIQQNNFLINPAVLPKEEEKKKK